MSSLRLINETIVSNDSVSTISVTDVFSADFDIYKVTVSNLTTVGTTQTRMYIRYINSSGSVVTASNYDNANHELRSNTSYDEERDTNTDKHRAMGLTDKAPEGMNAVYYFFNPFSSSSYSFIMGQTSLSQAGAYDSNKGIGVLKQSASMTGFQLLDLSTRPIKFANIRTYGLRVDS